MAISTLSKLTVPLDSNASASNQGLLMPKLQYRFRVSLENFGVSSPSTELTKQVMDVTRPNVSFDQMTVDIYNSRVYLAGKHTWEPITQFDFFEQSSAASGADYKFVTRIEILDGGNGANAASVLETFELYGCYLESTNYNTLNYATSEVVTIALTIRYDNAIQSPQGTGIGTAVGRTINTAITGGGAI